MAKRVRTVTGYSNRSRRPIDKALVTVSKTGLASTQVSTDILAPNGACTVTGIRWSFNAWAEAAGSAGANLLWSIVHVPDGYSASSMSATDATNFYEPEQNVLAFGAISVSTSASITGDGVSPTPIEGSTKTMRKMKSGDKIIFIAVPLTPGAETLAIRGVVQAFCME